MSTKSSFVTLSKPNLVYPLFYFAWKEIHEQSVAENNYEISDFVRQEVII